MPEPSYEPTPRKRGFTRRKAILVICAAAGAITLLGACSTGSSDSSTDNPTPAAVTHDPGCSNPTGLLTVISSLQTLSDASDTASAALLAGSTGDFTTIEPAGNQMTRAAASFATSLSDWHPCSQAGKDMKDAAQDVAIAYAAVGVDVTDAGQAAQINDLDGVEAAASRFYVDIETAKAALAKANQIETMS
jgi:hypothetical protein